MSTSKRLARKVTRAFKIDETLDKEITNRAKKSGITPSSLASQVLSRYVWWGQYTGKGSNFVTLDSEILKSLIDELDEEKLVEIARSSALVSTHNFLKFRYRKVNFESVINFIENLSLQGNIGEVNVVPSDPDDERRHEINVRHSLGIKWSIFLSEFVQGMFSSFLEMQTSSEVSHLGFSIIAIEKRD